MNDEGLLTIKNVTKRFGPLVAVDNISLEIKKNEVVGLIGANGAGKTTFFNIITGHYPPTEGAVIYKGQDITRLSPAERVEMGIVRTFQLTATFNELSVLDNLRLSYFKSHRKSGLSNIIFSKMKNIDDDEIYEYLEKFNLSHLAHKKTGSISLGERRVLEIAMALIYNPQILMLDEPFAGLSEKEIDEVLEILYQNVGQRTIFIVEHKVSKIEGLVQDICVMVEGEMICAGECQTVLKSDIVRERYWKMDAKEMAKIKA